MLDFLAPSSTSGSDSDSVNEKWKIIIADDDPEVINITHLLLRNLKYEDKQIELIDAKSGIEAIEKIKDTPDTALVLLDMIMEKEDAGIDVVKYIREDLKNKKIQIVLRTGQPGQFPEEDVVVKHGINDYRTKTELTKPKMVTTVIASLRAYENANELEDLNKSLEVKVHERTEELRIERDRLERANKTKLRFFSIISHDLRGPMSVMVGFNNLISNHIKKTYNAEKDDKLEEISGYLRTASDQVLGLLDSLMKWALKEQDAIPYNPESLSAKQCIEENTQILNPQAAAKGIKLESKVEDETIWADKNSLMTIIRNLVSNAIKFTPENGKVSVSCFNESGKVQLIVSDTGIGISQDKMEGLFEISEKKVSWGTKGEKGFGLGLNLVHDFVKMNKGEITVQSEVNKGTRFILSFPTDSKVV